MCRLVLLQAAGAATDYIGGMGVRLRDVAEAAGVSVKTVSNVVNNAPHVSESMRAKVQRAIADLGYRPNLSARQLKYGRGGFLTLAIPAIEWPYFAELAAKLNAAAADAGYMLLMETTRAQHDEERKILVGAQSHMVDGTIFSPLATTSVEIAARTDSTPMVLLGERSVPEGFDHVAVDSVAASIAMTEHLLSLGRRRIAAIGWMSEQGTASVRLRGYRTALEAAGVEYEPELVIGVSNYERAAGEQAMHELFALPQPPDAVFCFNDLMAVGALKACRDAGVRVPDEIAVAGFDDIIESRFTAPPLTTITPDLDQLTAEVLRLLLARIDEPQRSAEDIQVGWRLTVRGSTVAF